MTEAGKRHVDWLVGAKIPTYSGELYRSNFMAGVAAIEAEAVAARNAEIAAAVRELQRYSITECEPDPDAGRLVLRYEVLAIVEATP